GLFGLCAVELGRLDHRDIVVRARDRAVTASDTHVVLEVDFALQPAFDRAGRATVHAFGVVAMAAGRGHQVFAHRNSRADEPAFAVQRLAGFHATVAFDAQVQ